MWNQPTTQHTRVTTTDLLIAGGGPVGLAAAIHAARAGMHVVIVEPHEGVIDKACGEGIMPHGVAALRALNALPIGRPFVGIRYADASDSTLTAEGRFPSKGGSGLGVRRTVLHQALRERAKSLRVQFRKGRIKRFEDHGTYVCAETDVPSAAGRAERFCSRWLIGADGQRSKIREQLGVSRPPRFPARLGLRRHYEMAPWSDCVEVYFADGAEAYVTPVAANLVGVAFLFRREQQGERGSGSTSFALLLKRFPCLRARLLTVTAKSKTRGAGPFEQRVARRSQGNTLLIGVRAFSISFSRQRRVSPPSLPSLPSLRTRTTG